jgi:hypothetical protein
MNTDTYMTVYTHTHTHTHISTCIRLCFGGLPPATMQNGALLHEDSAAPAILVRAFTVLAVRPSGASIVTRLSRCSTCTPPPQRSQSSTPLRRGPLHTVAHRPGGVSGVPLWCMHKLMVIFLKRCKCVLSFCNACCLSARSAERQRERERERARARERERKGGGRERESFIWNDTR